MRNRKLDLRLVKRLVLPKRTLPSVSYEIFGKRKVNAIIDIDDISNNDLSRSISDLEARMSG